MVHHLTNLDSLKSAWQEKSRAKQQLQAASNPQLQLQQGNRLLAQNKLDEAIAYYRRALKLDPNSTQAHQQLAVALKQQGKLTEANLHYRQAIDARLASASSLQTPFSQSQLARIYLHQAQSLKAEGAWQKSIAACQEALGCDPQLAAAYQIWGDNLLNVGKTAEAIGYYGKALAIEPIAEVCLNLGSLSCKQQQWQLAIDYFQQALAIDTRCGSAYRNLARVYKKLGQQRLMLDCWFTALQIEPERANVVELCNLARMMAEIGCRDRAVTCYRQALILDPQSASVYLQLAELLIEEPQRGIAVLQQGLKYFPRHGELNLRLGQLLEPQDVLQAIAYYRRAIEARPQDWRAYFNLGNALTKQQKYDAAIDCYQQVCQLQPDYLPTYLQLAQAQSATAQWSAVVRVCQQGLSLNPQQEPLYNLLGAALIQLQQYETAIKVYACCLKLDPENTDSYRNLGLALMAEQRWSEAVSCYRQVLERKPNCLDWRQLGEAAAQAEDWKTSAIAWTAAVKLQPEEPWSYHHLGVALMKLEKWYEASQALQRSIDLNPDFCWSYHHLGDALAKQQRWQESSAAYRYFLTQETNGYAYERLGDNLMQQSESSEAESGKLLQEAQGYYYRALEVEPDYLQPYYKLMELRPYDGEICIMLAQTYARQSEWATAIIFYQIGLGIDPNCSQGHFELGILLEQQQHDEAIAHLRLAAKLDPHEPQYQSYLQAIVQ